MNGRKPIMLKVKRYIQKIPEDFNDK